MANTGITVPDELLEDFDDKVFELKAEGEIDRDASRSEVIRTLMEEWVEGNSKSDSTATMATAD
ncbi:ribbon-helix-helix domain-containing protein [Natrinema zhouii]|uniref:Ribbon-helix-helix protein, CopG family n=1 Tax=Natrinema zhouii TaxID=1710539 RepID=A0A7D6GPT7_9EURY|nr:ribbon-helix-helix domain-containing protein [Natrinema zhouii]QLK25382.1 ribbon-helix-helix domain-containing protein [Natrinema zhouii]